MDLGDEEYVNMESLAYIELKPDQTGSFQFGLVQGAIDYRTTIQNDKLLAEFSCEGSDKCDPDSGRSRALDEGEKRTGMIFFHMGDESGFSAGKM